MKSLVINPSTCSACKTEDVLHRQQGAELTAVARVQQASSLERLPGCEQLRETRTIHHCAPDSLSKTTTTDPHSPLVFPVLFLQETYVGDTEWDKRGGEGTSCGERQPM